MKSNRSLIRRTALVAATASAALVLAACGGSDEGHDMGSMKSESPSSATASAQAGAHNKADTAFAQEMIPHHRQAVEMADLAPSRASSAEVKDLATKIKGAQDPEIETMTGWLTAWGEKVPEEMPGMDHSAAMPGMMSAQDMEKLEKASGAAFDAMFLEMMVKHHEGAVAMATTEKTEGDYPLTKKLADEIIKGQTAEIEQMNKLLGKD